MQISVNHKEAGRLARRNGHIPDNAVTPPSLNCHGVAGSIFETVTFRCGLFRAGGTPENFPAALGIIESPHKCRTGFNVNAALAALNAPGGLGDAGRAHAGLARAVRVAGLEGVGCSAANSPAVARRVKSSIASRLT